MTHEQQLQRVKIFVRDDYKCQDPRCDNDIRCYGRPQLAHCIPQKGMYLKKYGPEILHHPLNLKSTCSGKCNSFFDINGKDLLIEKLVRKIKKAIAIEKEKIL